MPVTEHRYSQHMAVAMEAVVVRVPGPEGSECTRTGRT